MMFSPALLYDPGMEVIAEDEATTHASLVDTLNGIVETVFADLGHAYRSVHAKSHALLEGELQVYDNLRKELAQGVFAAPRTYRALVRISTNAGDVLPDSVTLPRGLALKLVDVDGARLQGCEESRSQDFVLANGKNFVAAEPASFLRSLKLLASTTDRAEFAKKTVSTVFRLTEKAIEALGGQSNVLEALGGHRSSHPLGESYFSQVPLRFGDHVAKLAIVPKSANFRALAKVEVAAGARDNALREEIMRTLAHEGGSFEVLVQLCRDLTANPIEDASVAWPEERNPYLPVASLHIPPQLSWSEERAQTMDDEMSFTPWNGIADHRPLGGIMRARKPTYEASRARRAVLNRCPVHLSGDVPLDEESARGMTAEGPALTSAKRDN